MPVCYDGSQVEFNAPKKTGGTKTVTLDVNQIPPHSSKIRWAAANGSGVTISTDGQGENVLGISNFAWKNNTGGSNLHTEAVGGGQAHNNIPPYSFVYAWERIA